MNIVLCNFYQADEIVMEIDEWKQKFQATMSKALLEFFTCIGDINCILKNYYMDFPCDVAVWFHLIIELAFLMWDFQMFFNMISFPTWDRYDSCFNGPTHIYNLFQGIINIYSPGTK